MCRRAAIFKFAVTETLESAADICTTEAACLSLPVLLRYYCTSHPSAENSKVLSGSRLTSCIQGWGWERWLVSMQACSLASEKCWWSQKEPKIQGFCPPSKGQDQRNYRLVGQFSARENHRRNLVGAQLTAHKIVSIDCGWVNHVSPRQLPVVITYMYLWLRGKVWMSFTSTLAFFFTISHSIFLYWVVMVWIAATSKEWEKDSGNFTQKVVIDG